MLDEWLAAKSLAKKTATGLKDSAKAADEEGAATIATCTIEGYVDCSACLCAGNRSSWEPSVLYYERYLFSRASPRFASTVS